ncbi:MAG: sel1 repeat family protein [Magnetococcales bacterium]|nr:sel1 repeat family protein [Magnetococcales bacterium]
MKNNNPIMSDSDIKLIKALGEQGNPKAQHNLGAMYLNGQGVEKNVEKAINWFRLAAEQGLVVAQHNLGTLYLQGADSMPSDPLEAAHWFTKAAMQGNPRSQYSLGALYFEGLGVEKNLEKAYIWISLSLQAVPDDKQKEVRQVRDFVASQLSPEEIESAQKSTIDIVKDMTIH